MQLLDFFEGLNTFWLIYSLDLFYMLLLKKFEISGTPFTVKTYNRIIFVLICAIQMLVLGSRRPKTGKINATNISSRSAVQRMFNNRYAMK